MIFFAVSLNISSDGKYIFYACRAVCMAQTFALAINKIEYSLMRIQNEICLKEFPVTFTSNRTSY